MQKKTGTETKTATQKKNKAGGKKIGILLGGVIGLFAIVLVFNQLQTQSPESSKTSPTTVADTYCQNDTSEYLLIDALKQPEVVCRLRLVPEDNVASLSAASKSFTRLQSIYFNKNIATISGEIGKITTLTTINIHHTTGTTLPPEIGKLKNLTVLQMNKADIAIIPPEIGQLQNLTQLRINNNVKPVALPSEVANLQKLQIVTLRGNSGLLLPDTLSQNKSIKQLDITENNLQDLPPVVYRMSNLTLLNAGHNNITGISAEIAQLVQLKELRLDNNAITSIPSLGNLQELETLRLNNNRLTELPEGIETLKKLKYLNISGNRMRREAIDSLRQALPKAQIVD